MKKGMNLTEAIIYRIKELSEEYNMPLSKWSMRAGITPSTIYGIMSKKAGCPRIQTIRLLCDVINLTLSEFFNAEYIDTAEYDGIW